MKLTNINLTRQIPATPEEVFDVWIDPEHPGGPWFSPNNDKQQSKTIFPEPKLDGLFCHHVAAAGQTWVHYGRFTKLERGKVVEHTWVCEATKGRESMVLATFEAKDGGTFVTLVHSGIPDDEEGRGQEPGWKWIMHSLAERASQVAAQRTK